VMTHDISRDSLRRFSLAVLLSLSILFAGDARSAEASATTAPAVEITPNHGPLASTVTVVTGQHFASNEQVGIFRGSRPFFAYQADANGSFVGEPHPLLGPAPTSGIITITAIGRKSGLRATTTFTVSS
jgi:hypothetical protein